jgi:hypothetical protein
MSFGLRLVFVVFIAGSVRGEPIILYGETQADG